MDPRKNKILQSGFLIGYLLIANTLFAFTRQDTLRGSNGRGRDWWDVISYKLNITLDTSERSISGYNEMTIICKKDLNDSLQLDLQEPLLIDSIVSALDKHRYTYAREGNVYWVFCPHNRDSSKEKLDSLKDSRIGVASTLRIYYHGKPRIARMPPWDGGLIWTRDSLGNPWIAVTCQGLGASIWWPCKDYGGDEAAVSVAININAGMPVVGNGKKEAQYKEYPPDFAQRDTIAGWNVKAPINAYNVTFYIGDYVSWTDTIMGEKGKLDLSFYALRYNEKKARKQFAVVKQMLHCYEYWLGPYPFYDDGYKLVEAPYLGMEHQSAIAYGNGYMMGYRGYDRTGSGVGDLYDYIIIHESGHEWFGNNITATDRADEWIHEGFTTYTESLFAECAFGKDKAFAYTRGHWAEIANDKPVIGAYGVNDEGSVDRYYKGAAVVHMVRMMLNDDERFRRLLRGLNSEFYHKTITSAEMEAGISKFMGADLGPFFDQYLRTAKIPELEWYIRDGQLYFRFNDVVAGFTLPLSIEAGGKKTAIQPTAEWQHIKWNQGFGFEVSKDFLIKVKE